MKNYIITAHVTEAHGYQIYTVKAKNEEEALRKYYDGEAEFLDEEFDIRKIDGVEAEEE